MKMYHLFFILLLVSCKTDNKKNDPQALTINFNLDKKPENIHSTGLIQNVKIVHLKDDILLGDTYRVIGYKDKLYLMDRKSQNLAIYDTLGNAVNTISSAGKGPHEYQRLVDFFIEPHKQTLNLISSVDKKKLVYDLDGNKVIKAEALPRPYSNLFKTDEGYVGYMGNVSTTTPKKVWRLNSDLEEQGGYFDVNKGFESYGTLGLYPFSSYDSKVYFSQVFDRNIYLVGNDEVYPTYTFNFGKHNLPDIKSIAELDKMPIREKLNYVRSIRDFQETDNFLIGKILFHGNFVLALYNKHDKTSHVASLEPYEDEYFFSFGKIVGINQKAIYALIDASDVIRMLENKDVEKRHPVQFEKMRTLLKNLDVKKYSNPFLVTYSLN